MKQKGIWLIQETSPEQLETLKEIAPEYELIIGWDEDEPNFPLEDIEIIYGWHKDKVNLLLNNNNSKLKWIQTRSAGVDSINLSILQEKNILLTSGSGIFSIPIAESVFGMLLAYTRGIGFSLRNQLQGNWNRNYQFSELHNSTIMIVGAGKIGTQVGKISKAFGMHTIGVTQSGHSSEYMDISIKQEDIIDYLKDTDIIIDILPLTDLTKYFFNKTIFDKVKEGSLFINVGRGLTVNTEDLIRALDQGKLAFAALDVFEEEPLSPDSPLWHRDDILITPHISGRSKHFNKRLFAIFEANLKAYINDNHLPLNLVDFKKKY
ncbi:MAG: hydroxyacid dehydrogenase [Clostridiales bacterium]|jgi:phosphoglycerate dehydrogenase-like enzyme|nr:hydroxyacid dehydrogenase [Clostridiales bacterium]